MGEAAGIGVCVAVAVVGGRARRARWRVNLGGVEVRSNRRSVESGW